MAPTNGCTPVFGQCEGIWESEFIIVKTVEAVEDEEEETTAVVDGTVSVSID